MFLGRWLDVYLLYVDRLIGYILAYWLNCVVARSDWMSSVDNPWHLYFTRSLGVIRWLLLELRAVWILDLFFLKDKGVLISDRAIIDVHFLDYFEDSNPTLCLFGVKRDKLENTTFDHYVESTSHVFSVVEQHPNVFDLRRLNLFGRLVIIFAYFETDRACSIVKFNVALSLIFPLE